MQQTVAVRIDLQSRGRCILKSVQTHAAALLWELRKEAGQRLQPWFGRLAFGSRRELERLRSRTDRLERRLRPRRDGSSPARISPAASERNSHALESETLAREIELALQHLTPEEQWILRLRFEVGDGRNGTPAPRENARRLEVRAVRKLWMNACQADGN